MTQKKLPPLLALVSVALVLVAGCYTTTGTGQTGTNQVSQPEPTNPPPQHDFTNGVYYFDETGAQFGIALSGFIQDHPEQEIVSVVSDDRCGYGSPCGYFVITRKVKT
jgi:hypothetical protein